MANALSYSDSPNCNMPYVIIYVNIEIYKEELIALDHHYVPF
jgi:hypothetical protein